jgi:hypothetical protein
LTKYIRVVRLGKWFPPHDPLAASIARLVILREDFLLELKAILANSLPELDEHSPEWRHIYFFRSSIRTLWEIQGTFTTIRMSPAFKQILSTRSSQEQRQLQQISSKLNAAALTTKSIRDSLGGHVLPQAVATSMNGMPYDRWGVLEVGRVIGTTHLKIAGELVSEMLVAGVPDDQRMAKMEKDIRAMAGLLPVVKSLELVLEMYAEARDLL